MKTVLSIGAHPDDIEIGCGGTESILRQKGYTLFHAVVTDGEEGDMDVSSEKLAVIRQSEARESARILGAEQVFFLGVADGSPQYSKETKLELMKLIRHLKPEIVFTHSLSDHFPDHAMVHQLSLAAIEGAQGPWYPKVRLKPHEVSTVLGYEVWHPMSKHQYAQDISTVMEKKLEALNAHRSQTEKTDYLGAVQGLAQYRGAMALRVKHAEVFEVHKIGRVL